MTKLSTFKEQKKNLCPFFRYKRYQMRPINSDILLTLTELLGINGLEKLRPALFCQ